MNFDDFDLWWRERGDENELSPMRAQLEKALCDKASRDIEYSISWRLARWHHFAAMKNGEDSSAARAHFADGVRQAQRAIELRKTVQREGVEADFWHAVNALEAARLTSKIAVISVLPRATRTLTKVLRCDEEFHFAGALRVLGRITHLKPKFLGGGAEKSLAIFAQALEIAPQNSTTRLYFAQALNTANRADDARRELETILSQPLDIDWKWEQARDKTVAARLLNEPRA